MKHKVSQKKLSRSSGHRKALFKNLASALIKHGEIKTTLAKAKAVRPFFEKLVTKAKKNTVHSRRLIAKSLGRKALVNKLVDEIAPVFKNKPGGYTRIIKLDQRPGDDATIVRLELVLKPKKAEKSKKQGKTKPQAGPKDRQKQKPASRVAEKDLGKVKKTKNAKNKNP